MQAATGSWGYLSRPINHVKSPQDHPLGNPTAATSLMIAVASHSPLVKTPEIDLVENSIPLLHPGRGLNLKPPDD